MDTIKKLQDTINSHAFELPARAWIYETDRWESLIFSIIRQYCDEEPERAGTAVNILRDWNLLDVDALAAKEEIPLEYNSAFKKIFQGLGFSEEVILEIARTLVKVATAVKANYEGKIQLVLRKYGDMIRDELLGVFCDETVDAEKISSGLSLWLQSALGMPILSEKPAVLEYYKQQGISREELLKIVDELDLNLGVIDYFIEQSPASD